MGMPISGIQRLFKPNGETLLAQRSSLVPIRKRKKKKKKDGDDNLEWPLARLHLFWKIPFPRDSEK